MTHQRRHHSPSSTTSRAPTTVLKHPGFGAFGLTPEARTVRHARRTIASKRKLYDKYVANVPIFKFFKDLRDDDIHVASSGHYTTIHADVKLTFDWIRNTTEDAVM